MENTDNSDKPRRGRRAGSLIFFLTLVRCALPTRQVVLEQLCNLLPIAYYAIGLEKHRDGTNHYHVFIELTVAMVLKELTPVLQSHFACNIQPVRNRRNVLHYLSKEDSDTLHNVSDSSLHVNYRICKWLKRVRRFSLLDPFVMSLGPSYYKYLERMFNEYRQKNTCNMWNPPTVTYDCWYNDVLEWLNDFVRSPYSHKKKQLFLWGESNIGKTSCIRSITRGMRVYTPDVGGFAFGDLIAGYYDIIIFEEFEFSNYNESTLKRLLEGEPTRLAVKGLVGNVVSWQKPIVMVSNHCPSGFPWFLNRVKVVEAVGAYWQSHSFPVVKAEVSSPPKVIEISSDSETEVSVIPETSPPCSPSVSTSSSDFETPYTPRFYMETQS